MKTFSINLSLKAAEHLKSLLIYGFDWANSDEDFSREMLDLYDRLEEQDVVISHGIAPYFNGKRLCVTKELVEFRREHE